ncbi:unnamed protein product, partial [Cyprideis torosa]
LRQGDPAAVVASAAGVPPHTTASLAAGTPASLPTAPLIPPHPVPDPADHRPPSDQNEVH